MIGIVGGGVSGLFLLHLLRERGADVVLFEASDTPGGVMRSVEVEGPNGLVTVDLGPQRVRLTPGIERVVRAVGLEKDLVFAPRGIPFTILWNGRLLPAPMSFGQALTSPLLSPRGKIEALVRDLVGRAPRRGESLEDALTRKLGRQVYERLAGPLFGGLYASDPAEMDAGDTLIPAMRRLGGEDRGPGSGRSLLLALRRAARMERLPVVSFAGGMGALPRAIARVHADSVHLGLPVTAITPRDAGGFDLTLQGSSVHEVDALVLTAPAPEAAPLLRSFAPGLATGLATLRYNPLAVVPLVEKNADERNPPGTAWPPAKGGGAGRRDPMGSGFKVTGADPYQTGGVTAHQALFGRLGLFTAFLGGMGHESLVTRTDEEILSRARRDFREITGREATPLLVHRTRMPAWDRSWRALDGLNVPDGVHLCAAYASRPGIPGRLEEAIRLAERLHPG